MAAETVAQALGISEEAYEQFLNEVETAYKSEETLDGFHKRLSDKPQLLLGAALAHHLTHPLFILLDRDKVPSRLALSLLAFFLETTFGGKAPQTRSEMAREFAKIPKPLLIAFIWHLCHTTIGLAGRIAK